MGEGRARIWAEAEAGLLQGLQTPSVSHSVSSLWTRPRDVGAAYPSTTWTIRASHRYFTDGGPTQGKGWSLCLSWTMLAWLG